MARVKKSVNTLVESEVAHCLLENPDYTATELKRRVEKSLKRKGYNYKFTGRTYLNIKKRLLPNLNPDNPLDQPWSIGACLKYAIPSEFIPLLVTVKTLYASRNKRFAEDREQIRLILTIRKARWFSRLYPAFQPIAEKKYPDGKLPHLGFMMIISDQYAEKERVAELMGRDPDTTELDTLYFGENPDINEGYLSTFFSPEIAEDYRKWKEAQK